MKTKYECVLEELKEIKDQHEKKRIRIESFDRITDMFKKDKVKFEETIQQLNRENEVLQEKLTELQVPVVATTTTTASRNHLREKTTACIPRHFILDGIPSELIPLVQQAIAENLDLKKSLSDREKELQTLKEQTNRMQSEDPQVVEQRLLQMVSKLKSDFSLMYHNQATFFLEKIDLLKQEQRDNIASLYRH